MGPGGRLLDGGEHWACTAGVHRVVDLSLLGPRHMAGGNPDNVYWAEAFDRYGVLNAFVTAAVVGLIGLGLGGQACVLAHASSLSPSPPSAVGKGKGRGKAAAATTTTTIKTPPVLQAQARLAALWAGAGLACVALSFLLERVAGVPCVPAMLTPSFLGWAVGTGLLTLAGLYVMMGTPCVSALLKKRRGRHGGCFSFLRRRQGEEGEEVKKEEKGAEEEEEEVRWSAPALVALGRNPLLVYVGHSLLQRRFPFGMASDGGGGVVEGLAVGLVGVASWAAVAWALERRGIVFRA